MSQAAWWQLDWIWTATGWVLFSAGVVVLVWALFWDRARGRRRCPKCWYDMSGVPGLTCPECGRTQRHDRRLFATRRPWAVAILGLVCLGAAYPTANVLTILRDGWVGTVPDVVLAWVTPLGEHYWPREPGVRADGVLIRELQRRVENESLSVRGYRVFLRRFYQKYPDQAMWTVQTRETWPRGEHVWAQLWWPAPLWRQSDRVAIRARLKGTDTWVGGDPMRRSATEDLGVLTAVHDGAQIEAQILLYPASNTSAQQSPIPPAVIYQGVLRTLRVRRPNDDGLTPIFGDEISRNIVAALGPTVVLDRDGEAFLNMLLSSEHLPPFEPDWSLSARVELREAETVVATCEFVYPMPGNGMIVDYMLVHTNVRFVTSPGVRLDTLSGPLVLRITGDRHLALRDIHRTAFWAGSVDIPISGLPPPGPLRR